MLDENLKPWLIEINHLPSFETDTPLDLKIKKNVLIDAFHLMNISNKDRTNFKNKRKADADQTIFTTKKIRISLQEKQSLFAQAQLERDQWEVENNRGYEKISSVLIELEFDFKLS